MKKFKFKVDQRLAYKVTTTRKHSNNVEYNLLNQNFNPVAPDEMWAGDITYLRTAEGAVARDNFFEWPVTYSALLGWMARPYH